MSNKSNKRRRKFIDARVQGALVRRIAMHYLLLIVASLGLCFIFQLLADPLTPFQTHLSQIWKSQSAFLMASCCLLPIFMVDTVSLSHRFVGPVERVRQTIRSASRGDHVKAVQLRPGDFWMDLADDLNGLLVRLNRGSSPNAAKPASSTADEAEPAELETP